MLFLALVGCAASDPKTGESAVLDAAAPATGSTGCDYDILEVDPDLWSGTLDLGIAIGILGEPWVETLRWDGRGTETELTIRAGEPTRFRYVSSGNPECGEFALLDLTVTLQTADGALDESFDANLRYDGGTALRLERWIAYDQLVGAWEPNVLDPDRHTAADVEVVADLGGDGSSGELALYALRADGETEAWDVARWPAP